MNPDTMNQPGQPVTPPMQGGPAPMTPAPQKSGVGGVIALVVIVLVLLAGGYFLMGRMNPAGMMKEGTMPPTALPNSAPEANAVDPNTVQGTGTSITDIETDLNATDLDSLSADLNAI